MKATVAAWVLFFASSWPVLGGESRFATITTRDGQTYRDVSVLTIAKDYIVVNWKGGRGMIRLDNLPDDVLVKLGVPTQAERARSALLQKEENERKDKERREELQRFEESQKAKGLVKYKTLWVTPEKKAQLEADERVAILVEQKSQKDVVFRVLQAMEHGVLCIEGEWNEYLKKYYFTGRAFFLHGFNNKVMADGDRLEERKLFWAGTYTYTTVQGVRTTVNSYATQADTAAKILRAKLLALPDKDGTGGIGDVENDKIAERDAEPRSSASGFIITQDGYVLTNNHVVKDARKVKVKIEAGLLLAKVCATDPNNDMAILKIEGNFAPVEFSPLASAKLGETVFTVGFPLPDLQGCSPKVTKGVISSLKGFKDDIRRYQIDAAVQPGNSGGPLTDECGRIVGIIASKLKVPEAENVNYAIKRSYIMAFIESVPDLSKKTLMGKDADKIKFEDAVDKVRRSTVQVFAY